MIVIMAIAFFSAVVPLFAGGVCGGRHPAFVAAASCAANRGAGALFEQAPAVFLAWDALRLYHAAIGFFNMDRNWNIGGRLHLVDYRLLPYRYKLTLQWNRPPQGGAGYLVRAQLLGRRIAQYLLMLLT